MTGPPFDPLGAFCRDNHVSLEGAASGPLAGLSFAAKDVFHVCGHRTGFGHPLWLDTHDPVTETAAVIEALLAAGARLAGRTLSDELAYSLTGENVHYGTPVNPRAPGRIPGGSSNGSAAAVAGGLVDFALGTDCGGSVRLPASYCGLFGLRPSHGSVSLAGVIPFAPSFDVVAWFAPDIALMSRVSRVLLGRGDARRARRLLIAADAFDLVSPECRAALDPAVDRIRRAVGATTSVQVSDAGLERWYEVFRTLQAAEIWENHGEWIKQHSPDFGPGVRERFQWASTVGADDVARAAREHQRIRQHLAKLVGARDVLCLPTSPRVAPLCGTIPDLIEDRYRRQAMSLLCIAGLGGMPQLTLPVAAVDSLPLGVSLVGAPGSDGMLLELAAEVCGDAHLARESS